MSSSVIHAKSLSLVTQLASNPPPNPRSLTQPSSLDSLVLYIARVPGSRDVFLTTMKPRLEVVTAEDVSSSLYYLHMNDGELSTGGVEELQVQSSLRSGPTPSRPGQRSHDLEDSQSDTASTSSGWNPRPTMRTLPPAASSQIRRKPVVTTRQGHSSASVQWGDRKPLGPRGEHVVAQAGYAVCGGRENEPPNRVSREGVYPRGSLSHDDPHRWNVSATKDNLTASVGTARTSQHGDDALAATPEVLSMTVIRRDPASGNQWNVGKIVIKSDSYHSRRSSSIPGSKTLQKTNEPLASVEIFNPGYDQFITRGTGDGVFRRDICSGEPTSFWTRSLPTTSRARPGSEDYSRRSSSSGKSLDGPNPSGERDSTAEVEERKLPPSRGYHVTSPWGGRCEFMTGGGGRSLKCQHFLPSSSSAGQPASELRFNLPRSTKTAAGGKASMTQRLSSAASSTVSSLRRRSIPSSRDPPPSLNPSLPPSLSPSSSSSRHLDTATSLYPSITPDLLQAPGGGRKGQDAKLGKLILHHEALQMVDLAVGANMALWARAYLRPFST